MQNTNSLFFLGGVVTIYNIYIEYTICLCVIYPKIIKTTYELNKNNTNIP